MAQPSIPGTDVGKVATVYGSDGTNWIALLVSALGKLQVEIDASVLPTDAATETTLASALTALQSLQNLVGALHDVGLDELDVQVIASALPTDAATQTTLAAALTALQSIQNLVGALGAVDLDRLRVESKDGDKLFGFESIVEEALSDTNLPGAYHTEDGTPVPSGKVWKITHASFRYDGTVPSYLLISVDGLAGGLHLKEFRSITSGYWYMWTGEVYLQYPDFMQLVLANATATDDVYFRYAGVQMNAP